MSIEEEARTAIEKSVKFLGGIDILVLNHVISSYEKFEDFMKHDKPDSYFKTNIISYIYLTHFALPYLKQNSGSIVVSSSFVAKTPVPYTSIYAPTKRALHGFFDTLRLEFERENAPVSITLIVIGSIDTAGTHQKTKDSLPSYIIASSSDCAYSIVRSGALRYREDFFPKSLKLIDYLHVLFPQTTEALILQFLPNI